MDGFKGQSAVGKASPVEGLVVVVKGIFVVVGAVVGITVGAVVGTTVG